MYNYSNIEMPQSCSARGYSLYPCFCCIISLSFWSCSSVRCCMAARASASVMCLESILLFSTSVSRSEGKSKTLISVYSMRHSVRKRDV